MKIKTKCHLIALTHSCVNSLTGELKSFHHNLVLIFPSALFQSAIIVAALSQGIQSIKETNYPQKCKKCCWQLPFLLQGTIKVYHSALLMFRDKWPWNISEISKRSIKEHKNCGVLYIFDPPPTKSPPKCFGTCV